MITEQLPHQKKSGLRVHPAMFNKQLKWFSDNNWTFIKMSQLENYKSIEKVVAITFDDGYQNNLINAAPILKKYNFSATCYLVSQRIGTSNTWDLDKGITQRPLMTQSEIQEWLNLGLDIGAHTQTHPLLEELSEQKSQEEVFNCKADLEQMFKVSIKDFCYPFGRFNEPLVNMIKEAGYITATTMSRGRATPQSNKLTLPRMPITHHTLPHLFLAKILTKYEDKR